MVWNTPGKGGDSPDNNRRNPWPPRRPSGGGNGLGGGFDRLRDLFGGGNGGGIGRWVLLGVALVVVLTSFTLRSEEHTSELQSRENLVCRLLLEKKKKKW